MRSVLIRYAVLAFAGVVSCAALATDLPNGTGKQVRLQAIQGIWELSGYGDIYQIRPDGTGLLFEFTRETCLAARRMSKKQVSGLFDSAAFSASGKRAEVRILGKKAAFISRLTRLDSMPPQCTDGRLIVNESPASTFLHFWHTFNDYYAFFKERSVNWMNAYKQFAPLIDDKTSNSELFAQLCALVQPIGDGHIEVESEDDSCTSDFVTKRQREIAAKFAMQGKFGEISQYTSMLIDKHRAVRDRYLVPGSIRGSHGNIDDPVAWGVMAGNIGYLRVDQMSDLDSDNHGAGMRHDIWSIHSAMKRAMRDLRHTAGLVIDVRENGGGYDEVGFAIASYFTDRRRLALSKWARSYQGDTEPVHLYLNPVIRTPYLKPVAVVAGPDSASAAETFLLSMTALPHVTLVGENTNGILSDELRKELPNGWSFRLSNEVYVDNQSMQFEATGVPPHVRAATFSIDAIERKVDPAIEAAIRVVRGK